MHFVRRVTAQANRSSTKEGMVFKEVNLYFFFALSFGKNAWTGGLK